jgi:hypothetical protein
MSTAESILQLLSKIPEWKRVAEAVKRIDALEGRLATLEDRLKRAPSEACPRCGGFEYRVESSRPDPIMGDAGAVQRSMKCKECGFTEKETFLAERGRR